MRFILVFFEGYILLLCFHTPGLPNAYLNPASRVFWYFWHSNRWHLHILDGHNQFRTYVIIVHHDELGYCCKVLHELSGMYLFAKLKYLVFKSRRRNLEGRLPGRGWLLEAPEFRLGTIVHLRLLPIYHWMLFEVYLVVSDRSSNFGHTIISRINIYKKRDRIYLKFILTCFPRLIYVTPYYNWLVWIFT